MNSQEKGFTIGNIFGCNGIGFGLNGIAYSCWFTIWSLWYNGRVFWHYNIIIKETFWNQFGALINHFWLLWYLFHQFWHCLYLFIHHFFLNTIKEHPHTQLIYEMFFWLHKKIECVVSSSLSSFIFKWLSYFSIYLSMVPFLRLNIVQLWASALGAKCLEEKVYDILATTSICTTNVICCLNFLDFNKIKILLILT